MSARGISALNAREAPGCPRRLARCVAMWCDAQRRVVERCDAPREVPRRAALPTVMSISPTRLIDQANMAGRGATSRQHCCRSRHLFRSRRKSKRNPDDRHRGVEFKLHVPCHTTRHAGPHRAVRWVEVSWQGGESPTCRRSGLAVRRGALWRSCTTICGHWQPLVWLRGVTFREQSFRGR